MNKLKTMVCAIFTLMLVNTSTAYSDSGNFAGPYVGFQLLGLGAEFNGVSNSSAGTQSGAVEDKVPVGATAATIGYEVGYVLPLGDMFLIDVGGQYLSKTYHLTSCEDACAGNVAMTMDDHFTGYIAQH